MEFFDNISAVAPNICSMVRKLLFLFLVFGIISCDQSEDNELSVFTEEVLFASGEKTITSGRILSQDLLDLSDHGFDYSITEDFSSKLRLSLGERSKPGRFIGQMDGLLNDQDYYVRSFIIDAGKEIIGNVLHFKTGSPRVADFSPKQGKENTTIVIQGVNFNADTKILWQDMILVPESIEEESFIIFRVPAINQDRAVFFKIVSQSDTIEIDTPFEYIIGKWEDRGQKSDMLKSINHVFFEDSDYYYYGTGRVASTSTGVSDQFFKVNKTTLDFQPVDFSGDGAEGMFFTHSGYLGGGSLLRVKNSDQFLTLSNAFYHFDNGAFTRLADVPVKLYQAVAIETGQYVYLYGGELPTRDKNKKIYRYDIGQDVWSEIGESPIGLFNYYPYFKVENKHYFIDDAGTLHIYDIASDTWSTGAGFPENVRTNGVSVPFKGKVYVGMQDVRQRFYEYLPADDRWRTINPRNHPMSSTTQGFWTDDQKINIVRMNQPVGDTWYFWALDPLAF